jgi:hypothetical protein
VLERTGGMPPTGAECLDLVWGRIARAGSLWRLSSNLQWLGIKCGILKSGQDIDAVARLVNVLAGAPVQVFILFDFLHILTCIRDYVCSTVQAILKSSSSRL